MFCMTEDESQIEKQGEEIDELVDLELYITVIEKFGPNAKPAFVLRKVISNKFEVQHIMKKALNDEIIVAKIKIKNKYLAVPKLARLGLLNPDEL